MAQTGYTPIQIYSSATTTNVPLAANLAQGELAINTADGKLFYKDSGGVVQVIASKSGNVNVSSFSAGTTGLTPNSATSGAITLAGTLATTNGGTGLTSFTSGGAVYATSTSALTTGTLPISAGGTNSTATPTAGGVSYGTGTAYAITSAGTSGQPLISAGAGAPSFGALAIGTANTNISGALTPTNGGTGVATLTGLAYGNGTSAFTAATSAQVLTVIGTVPIANGGTGSSTLAGAGIAQLGVAETFTASQRGTITTSNTGSFDESVTNNFQCTPAGTLALTFTNHTAGQSGYILLINTGGYAITAASTTKVGSTLLSTISSAGTYLISYFDNGTNAYLTASGALA